MTRGLGEGGSLGTFICMQPVEIFGYDFVQYHIHIYARAVSTGAKWWWESRVPFRTSEEGELSMQTVIE